MAERHGVHWWDRNIEYFTLRGTTFINDVFECTVYLEQEGWFRVCIWWPRTFLQFSLEFCIKNSYLVIALIRTLVQTLQHKYNFTIQRFTDNEMCSNLRCNNCHDSVFRMCVWYMLSKHADAQAIYVESQRALKLLDIPFELQFMVSEYAWSHTQVRMQPGFDDHKFKEDGFGGLLHSPTLKQLIKTCCPDSFKESGYHNLGYWIKSNSSLDVVQVEL